MEIVCVLIIFNRNEVIQYKKLAAAEASDVEVVWEDGEGPYADFYYRKYYFMYVI